MTEAELRRRLRVAESRAAGSADDALDLIQGELVPAAVLVPILLGPDPSILLTLRSDGLSRHAGQVALPGGRMDPEDADAVACALREAREEIGLDPAAVEVVAHLPGHTTGTGYRVTPIVGLLSAPPTLAPDPREVAEVFELKLSAILDPAGPQKRRAHLRGRWREFWVYPHPTYDIWGATAAILRNLGVVLTEREAA